MAELSSIESTILGKCSNFYHIGFTIQILVTRYFEKVSTKALRIWKKMTENKEAKEMESTLVDDRAVRVPGSAEQIRVVAITLIRIRG